MRLEYEPEWRGMLIAGLANSPGLVLVVIVTYATFARDGTVFWMDGWRDVDLPLAVEPTMSIPPLFHRAPLGLTGPVHLGPLTMHWIFTMGLLSSTGCPIPL